MPKKRMNVDISAHMKYKLQIGLQRLFRTFSYVPCFKQKGKGGGAMNSNYFQLSAKINLFSQ